MVGYTIEVEFDGVQISKWIACKVPESTTPDQILTSLKENWPNVTKIIKIKKAE